MELKCIHTQKKINISDNMQIVWKNDLWNGVGPQQGVP